VNCALLLVDDAPLDYLEAFPLAKLLLGFDTSVLLMLPLHLLWPDLVSSTA